MTENDPDDVAAACAWCKRPRRWQVLPIMEIVVLAIGALLPLVLKDYLTVYATRVLILCLFALSFDLVWDTRVS